MKAQLLEDIGASREPAAAPGPSPDGPGQPASRPQPTAEPEPPDPEPEPEPVSRAEPELGNFDYASWQHTVPPTASAMGQHLPPASAAPHAAGRWGRRAAIAGIGLAVLGAVAAGAKWLHGEQRLDASIAVLARAPLPDRLAAPVPISRHAATADTPNGASGPSALVLLPEPPNQPSTPAVPQLASAADITPALDAAPAGKPAQRHARLSAKAKRQRPERGAAPRATASGQATSADVLRLCRQQGYHAALCRQQGCASTKFGLVCKGKRR